MTIGYLHVGVSLLTTRILWDPDYIKHSTDLAISRPDGEVFLCELGSVQVVYHSCEDSKCQYYPCTCWKWETQQIDSRKLRLTRNNKKNLLTLARMMTTCFLRVSITDLPSLAILESFILTHTFLGHFPILLPCKNTELAHSCCYTAGFSQATYSLWYTKYPSDLSPPYIILKYLTETRLHR